MRKKIKSRLLDAFIVFMGVAVCCTSLTFFFREINRHTIRRDKEAIATIVYKYKIAHRKFNDRVVWERLWQNAPLYNADKIRTAEQSYATICFKDGTKIDILASTMIQVFYNENGYYLSVGNGSVSVDSTSVTENKAIHLKLEDGSDVACEPGSRISAVTNSGSGVNSVTVQAGIARVETVSGEKESISKGQAVTIEKQLEAKTGEKKEEKSVPDVVIKKRRISVTSVPKELHILSFDREPKRVELAWTLFDAEKNDDIVVQTSLYKDFSEIEQTQHIKEKTSCYIDTLPEGAMYWRIFYNEQKESAESGRIFVDYASPVMLSSPADNSTFTYKKTAPIIPFAWEGNRHAEYYRLDVSKSRDMKNPVLSEQILAQRVSLNSLESGTYYWTVTPYYGENSIEYRGTSPVRSFTVSEQRISLPPETVFPSDGTVLLAEKDGISLSFGWKGNAESAGYELVAASDSGFNSVVFSRKTEKTRFQERFGSDKIPAGTYYWKVIQTDADGEVLQSVTKKFTVQEYLPAVCRLVYPPDLYEVERTKLSAMDFTCRYTHSSLMSPDSKETYVLQISSASDFEKLVYEKESDGIKFNGIDLNGGRYFWRVEISNGSGAEKIRSETRQLFVLDNLASPVIAIPAENSVITLYDDRIVHCEWVKVPEADYYNIRLYDPDSETLIAEYSDIEKTGFDIAVPESAMNREPKELYFTVQAVSRESDFRPFRYSNPSDVSFKVRMRKTVQLSLPEDSAKISGLKAVREKTLFSWKYGDPAASAVFELEKLQPDGSYRSYHSVRTVKSEARIERIPAGFYRWTVKAVSAGGKNLSAQGFRSFEVKEIPSLKKAELLKPEDRTVMNGAFFRNNRFVDFEWKPVEDATDYDFVLYQKKIDGTLKKVYEVNGTKKTSVRLKKLAQLDIGGFEWHVTAYSHAADGFEEQKSSESVFNFEINFGLPSEIKTVDPGKMYGE